MNVAHISHDAARLVILAYFAGNRERIYSASRTPGDVESQAVLTANEKELVEIMGFWGYYWRPDRAACFSRPV